MVYLAVVGSLLAELWVRLVCTFMKYESPDPAELPLIVPGAWSNVLPLRLIWVSSVWRIIGGGDQTMSSVLISIVADVFSEDERYVDSICYANWV